MTPTDQEPARSSLLHDRSFWGVNLTQFLGAFNDNLFKQLVMLLCVDRAQSTGQDYQGLGMILFAWPFIAFSGFAGFLSDRYRKRTIIVLCKAAEFLIVVLGLIGFMTGDLAVLLGVLCLMGVHSAFFGPSKFGILPELLHRGELPRANGSMLMATFLAIIFGLSAAGAAKQVFDDHLWIASLPCLIIALIGLGTSLLIRPTPVAQPHLTFDWSSVAIAPDTRRLLWADRKLLGVLIMSSVFWFVGGTVYPSTINAFGKNQLRLNDLTTGMMAASTGLGIAIGCIVAGILSKNRVRSWLVRVGAGGLSLSLAALFLPGPGFEAVREEIRIQKLHLQGDNDKAFQSLDEFAAKPDTQVEVKQSIPYQKALLLIDSAITSKRAGGFPSEDLQLKGLESAKELLGEFIAANPNHANTGDATIKLRELERGNEANLTLLKPTGALLNLSSQRGSLLGPYGSVVALVAVGFFAGFYSVPLQVYVQTVAPIDQKGRVIGAWNLFNWIGIAGSGFVYGIGHKLLVDWMELPHGTLFGFAALLMLPVALFYRPPETQMST